MCARLLACPLCSQPGFLTLDALRAGLVSVATRPLVCPVCNEVLLGIDKLTIHLFGHTINLNNNVTEPSEHMDVVAPDDRLIALHDLHNVALQNRNTLKTQQLNETQPSYGSSATCTESLGSTAGSKIHVMNPQPQAQSQDLLGKDATQQFVSDYNYDMIKINIMPQPRENHSATLGPTASLQEMLETHCATQSFCDGDIKQLNVSEEKQTEKKVTMSDLTDNWMEKQNCGLPAAEKVTKAMDANVYQSIETECAESSTGRHDAGERSIMNLMSKESDLSDFQSIQDASLEQRHSNDKQNPHNTNETNPEGQDHNLKEQRRISTAQACAETSQSATPKKTERCDTCGLHFPDVNILTLHKQLVHEQKLENVPGNVLKNYSCHLCSKVFKMKGSLMVHTRVVHSGRDVGSLPKDGQIQLSPPEHPCPHCGRKFKREHYLNMHLKTHEIKHWECDVCNKVVSTKYFLTKHKLLHSGEMPYKCKICNKNFTFQQSYHKHMLYHKDDKPHICPTCGKRFKEISTLHNHKRIHTGEKPYKCETCGKLFRQRVSYLVHRRIHTGAMPYTCTICNRNFRYKLSQRTHRCLGQTSENAQQSSGKVPPETNDEMVMLQASNILQSTQDSQLIVNTVNTVSVNQNKFVLIINNQGQHILALEPVQPASNMSVQRVERVLPNEFECTDSTNQNLNSNKTTSIDDLDSAKEFSETLEKAESDNEEINMKDTNDLVTLMSPLDNSLSSTFEMETLRVSSPKRKESLIESYADLCREILPNEFECTDNTNQNLNNNKTTSTDDLDSAKEFSETLEKAESDNEEINMKDTNDLVTLMSPLDNSLFSTFEMETLRVSSPKRKESLIESYANLCREICDDTQMSFIDSSVEQNLTCDKDIATNDCLQTIDIESLKELLYQ